MSPLIAPSAMMWLYPDTTNLSPKSANLTYKLGGTNRRSADVSEIDGE